MAAAVCTAPRSAKERKAPSPEPRNRQSRSKARLGGSHLYSIIQRENRSLNVSNVPWDIKILESIGVLQVQMELGSAKEERNSKCGLLTTFVPADDMT